MSIHEQIMAEFPARRTKEEKSAFRAWAAAKAEAQGWHCVIEETSTGKFKNLIIGKPDSAALLVTARYDTGCERLLPTVAVARNWGVWLLWALMQITVLFVLSLLADFGAGALGFSPQIRAICFVAAYLLLLVLASQTFPNRHTANVSSGAAAVLELCEKLPEDLRGKVAFILFDGAERRNRGSRLWAKDHPELAWMRLTLNL